MFKSFFLSRKWIFWAFPGLTLILLTTWYKVQIDVAINNWYGTFYDMLQKALSTPNSVEETEIFLQTLHFAKLACPLIVVAVLLEFFISHFVFRWRTAMNDYYMSHWSKLRHIEGAAQRVQEDTMRFARIVEGLGVAFMRAMMTLVAFLPLLWVLSKQVPNIFYFGEVPHALVYIAILSAIFGTVILAFVGIKLPGLEFNNQKVEAAYRKELVFGEDHQDRAEPMTVKALFSHVRKNYFTLYLHYMYFNVAKWSYIQFSVIIPIVAMVPAIATGAITFGVFQQILRAFNRVEDSFQFLVHSWSTIVELISIYKRLRAFELEINFKSPTENASDLV